MTRIPQGPKSGQRLNTSTLPPEVVEEANHDLDALGKILDRPNDPSRLLSQLAVRTDGTLLVSLDDAADLNLEGREVVSMMVLNADEHAFVKASAKEFLDDRAARVLGKLPRRST